MEIKSLSHHHINGKSFHTSFSPFPFYLFNSFLRKGDPIRFKPPSATSDSSSSSSSQFFPPTSLLLPLLCSSHLCHKQESPLFILFFVSATAAVGDPSITRESTLPVIPIPLPLSNRMAREETDRPTDGERAAPH